MPVFNFQLVVAGDLPSVQSTLRSALEAEDFTIKEEHKGEWKASHGSIAKTMFLGAFAGSKSQHEVLIVKFTPEGGDVRVDLHRPLVQAGGGDDDGIEEMRLYDAYKTSLTGLRDRVQATGSLVSANV
ncbi:hypothetical protein ABCS02_25955 [Microbacterium sp. X-17]|uniref:hypothetical protein n=1 Tax=Microbacterium sp. X-17 TaxID=3144404 RepID=UPI0031F526BC